ncbi:uncharacterized protein BT62DRAFT_932996 [Guyanagaster necrorhizus]|uniref:Proteophosphoglycan ppg4 n=1 Tax=Guyanagaster necrorhizus TaxID=856835 RepID=A0A9P7VR61_9AGAR|nr:uncharacterized protein BT62DRAFT_932996 [Guyanagaster necrorhizus MCA 3950]KAG7445195.1 hypothetical protein BT62DRAFT_932996 [Guyanagaster necrorhizus MCA 3950]
MIFFVVTCCLSAVGALPLSDGSGQAIARRGDNGNNTGSSVEIWMPIVVVVVLLTGGVGVCWWRKSATRGPSGVPGVTSGSSTTTLPTANGGVRELTAEQLAGTVEGAASNPPSATRTRRGRRPRRTPSQISTISLPAYNKEPGEQELVIFRGPADMEDVPLPVTTTVEMPPVDEDGETSMHSRNQSDGYSPMPDSPNDMPLLHEDTTSTPDLQPPGEGMPIRRSVDSGSVESSLMRSTSRDQEPDPRGAAPAYFEVAVVDLSQDALPRPSSSVEVTPPSPGAPASPPPRRTFRSILGALGSGNARSVGAAVSHSRPGSNGSNPYSRSSSSMSYRGHRPSQSSTGSLLSMHNPLVRKKSTATLNSQHLTSPSLISLNSISSPLSHTLVRTEFTYPKSGPTPEQLKFISSRESVARFGVPYGEEAVRWASTSRLALSSPTPEDDVPPPEFDFAPSGSRPRADTAESSNSPAVPSPLAHSFESPDEEVPSETLTSVSPFADRSSSGPSTAHPSPNSPVAAEDTPNTSSDATDHFNEGPSSSPLPADVASKSVEADPTSHPSNESGPSSPVASPSMKPTLTSSPRPAPVPVAASVRSASRASSIRTFATALESMGTASSDDDYDEAEEPGTPRLAPQHILENIDATVRA